MIPAPRPSPTPKSGSAWTAALAAIVLGIVVMLAGTMPRNILYVANLRFLPTFPWAALATGVYIWLFWRYLSGWGPPTSTALARRRALRANPLPLAIWGHALLAGGLGIATLVLSLGILNRLVDLPQQTLPDLSAIPRVTTLSLLVVAAPVAGVIEEASFRGYMQGPIERRWGILPAILITGTMFAVAHLDFTLALWPYYVAVAAIYGLVTHLTDSILPAIVLHTFGNLYSNLDLLLHGRAEWQAPAVSAASVWQEGFDKPFMLSSIAVFGTAIVTAWAFRSLAWVSRRRRSTQEAPLT